MGILLDIWPLHFSYKTMNHDFHAKYYAAYAVLGFMGLYALTEQLRRWHRAASMDRNEMEFTVHFHGTSRVMRVSGKMLVGDFLRFVASRFGVPQSSIRMTFRGRIVNDYFVALNAAGLASGCSVQIDLRLRAGTQHLKLKSIIVEELDDLLHAIKKDFDAWVSSEKPVYKAQFENDPNAGKSVVWDGFSGPVKYFFEEKKIVPSKEYSQYYSDESHNVAVSYVWRCTGLWTIAGSFSWSSFVAAAN